MFHARGQGLPATCHRLHPEHGDQDAAVGQEDEDERAQQDADAEETCYGPVQGVVVARQSEHGRVVAKVAQHSDGVTEGQSFDDHNGEQHGTYRVRPRESHHARHAEQRVDGVLAHREANSDQAVVGENGQRK